MRNVIDLDAIEARAERRAQLRRYTIVSCRTGFACEPGGNMVTVERDRTVTEYASETPPADADLALVIADARAHRARAHAAEEECDHLRVALADAELILEQRERQLTAALTFVAEERARCATVCREVASRYRSGACGCAECEGRGDGARECAEAIERGAVGR